MNPRQSFNESWLVRPADAAQLDNEIEKVYSNKPGWSISNLVKDMDAAIKNERFASGTHACVLIAELLYCSEEKNTGQFFNADKRTNLPKPLSPYRSLCILRNACFHPAYTKPTDEQPPILQLVEHLSKNNDPIENNLGKRLKKDWQLVGRDEILAWAINLLSSIGYLRLNKPRDTVPAQATRKARKGKQK